MGDTTRGAGAGARWMYGFRLCWLRDKANLTRLHAQPGEGVGQRAICPSLLATEIQDAGDESVHVWA
jgi:hypothetical protein